MPDVHGHQHLNDDQKRQIQNDHLEHILNGQPESEVKPVLARSATGAPAPRQNTGEAPIPGQRIQAPAYLSKGQQMRERNIPGPAGEQRGTGQMDAEEVATDKGELAKLDAWNEQCAKDNIFGISDMQRADRLNRERTLAAGKTCPTCNGRGYMGNPDEQAAIEKSAAQKAEVISEKVAEVGTLEVINPVAELAIPGLVNPLDSPVVHAGGTTPSVAKSTTTKPATTKPS